MSAEHLKSHSGDCTIYSKIANGRPVEGICTCGFGWSRARTGDWSLMYSEERKALQQKRQKVEPVVVALDACMECGAHAVNPNTHRCMKCGALGEKAYEH